MATKLIHKNSKVQFKNATGAQLEFGELAINYHASGPYLQAKGEDGEVHSLGGVYIGSSAPSNPLPGRWWFDDANSKLFLYDGSAWQIITGSGGGGSSTTVVGGDGIVVSTSGSTATVKVDLASAANGLVIDSGKLKASVATTSSLGTVKIGDGIDVDAAGEISVDLSGIDVNADLGYTAAADKGTVTNSAGDDATIPLADGTNAGLFTAAEKLKLDGIETGAQVNGKPVFIGENPPGTPADGDLWWNSSDDSGRLYVYYDDGDSQQWVEASPQGDTLTESDADDLYLSKVSDDTAEGEITFEKLTTHEAGVNVTGGGSGAVFSGLRTTGLRVYGTAEGVDCLNWDSKRLLFQSSSNTLSSTDELACFQVAPQASTVDTSVYCSGFASNLQTNGTHAGDIAHFRTNSLSARDGGSAVRTIGFHAGQNLGSSNSSDINAGFLSELNTTNSINYNFYAAGSAPNYFAGATEIVGTTKLKGSTSAANTDAYIYATRNSSISPRLMIQRQGATSSTENALEVIASTEAQPIQFALTYNGNFTRSALAGDYRLTDYRIFSPTAIQNASQIVSQLSPKLEGFIAHELQSYVPEAVIGTQDAEEAIGTLADYNGTVLETEVTEPSAEELEYTEEVETDGVATMVTRTRTWTPSGTRPVYQGVDQTKLIPLLTKALQEVLTKNEDLEARIAALEGA